MRKTLLTIIFFLSLLLTACSRANEPKSASVNSNGFIKATNRITRLTNGLSVVRVSGNDHVQDFLNKGGASSDEQVIDYLRSNANLTGAISFGKMPFACSTIANNSYFGRNFDWQKSNSLIVLNYPNNAYSSISTVSLSFINQAAGSRIPDNVLKQIAVFAPLDGMNEKGVAISVNMIDDNRDINQSASGKKNLTTTTAIRTILNKASNTQEAIKILKSTNLHASEGLNIHFAITDKNNDSVAVEYIDNQMHVTKTPTVTNFYLTKGKRYGEGSEQSKQRYQILNRRLKRNPRMNATQIRDALNAVSKHNFANDGEITEWSVVYNLRKKEATYYHRENFKQSYKFKLK